MVEVEGKNSNEQKRIGLDDSKTCYRKVIK